MGAAIARELAEVLAEINAEIGLPERGEFALGLAKKAGLI